MDERVLTFPNFTVKFGDNGNRITFEIYESKLPKEGKTVTGFKFWFFSEVIVRDLENEREFVRWMKRDFPSLLQSNLRESIELRFPLDEFFPYMESYDVKVKVSADTMPILTFEILTEIEVTFAEEVPYERFSEGLRRFVSHDFHFTGLTDEVNDTIDYIINYEQPQTDFLYSAQTSPPSRIQLLWGKRRAEFSFPEHIRIHIYLQNPLPENVLNLLVNSSDERDFILNFSVLLDNRNIKEIVVASTSQDDKGIRSIGDVLEFLREVTK